MCVKPANLTQALAPSDDIRVIVSAVEPYAILHTSRAWATLSGFKYMDVVNQSGLMLVPAQSACASGDPRREAEETLLRGLKGETIAAKLPTMTKMGELETTIHCCPLLDCNGVLTHVCIVIEADPDMASASDMTSSNSAHSDSGELEPSSLSGTTPPPTDGMCVPGSSASSETDSNAPRPKRRRSARASSKAAAAGPSLTDELSDASLLSLSFEHLPQGPLSMAPASALVDRRQQVATLALPDWQSHLPPLSDALFGDGPPPCAPTGSGSGLPQATPGFHNAFLRRRHRLGAGSLSRDSDKLGGLAMSKQTSALSDISIGSLLDDM